MQITARRLTLGKDPEAKLTDSGKMYATFSAAENTNKNEGTKEKPKWKTTKTSWFNFIAYGDTAEEVLAELGKGDSFELIEGSHDNEYKDGKNFLNYTVWKFNKL
jgi:single-stranded DNA-binding protein